ncbi:hypothetical protein FACS189499_01280 [Clostridia bacterium]|nr:hypothetical protein FACS189499_01280 [Clostridia bacterium]
MAEKSKSYVKARSARRLRGFIIIVLIAAVAVTGYFNRDYLYKNVIENFRGIANKVEKNDNIGEGFPLTLPGSAKYSFERFGTNFSLLTDTYLYTYTSSGKQLYAQQHSYGTPVQKAAERRLLLFDLNGHSFSLFNKNGKIGEITYEEKIATGFIGANDMTAIITNSPIYSGVMYIYDANMKLVYKRILAEENVTSVLFTENSSEIIMLTIGFRDGDVVSEAYRLDITVEDGVVWKTSLPANSIAVEASINDGGIAVLCDNLLLGLQIETGEFLWQSELGGVIVKPVLSPDGNFLISRDYINGRTLLTSFSGKDGMLNVLEPEQSGETITVEAETAGGKLYVLSEKYISEYSESLELLTEYVLPNDFMSFVIIAGKFYLLGAEQVVLFEPTA